MKKRLKAAVKRIDRAIAEFDTRLVAQSARLVEVERMAGRYEAEGADDRATRSALAECEAKRHAAEVTLVTLREAYRELKQTFAGRVAPAPPAAEDVRTRLDDPDPSEAAVAAAAPVAERAARPFRVLRKYTWKTPAQTKRTSAGPRVRRSRPPMEMETPVALRRRGRPRKVPDADASALPPEEGVLR